MINAEFEKMVNSILASEPAMESVVELEPGILIFHCLKHGFEIWFDSERWQPLSPFLNTWIGNSPIYMSASDPADSDDAFANDVSEALKYAGSKLIPK